MDPRSLPAPTDERSALIDHAALRHNVTALKNLIGPDTQLIAVIKANAYGHGDHQVARTVLAAGADRLGVAHVSEALSLRSHPDLSNPSTAPILAWLHTPGTDFSAALTHSIELGASGWDLDPIADAARSTGRTATVHLKIDTGLGRNGCPAEQWPAFFARAAELQVAGLITVVGLFSHLAVADELDRAHQTDAQLAEFHRAYERAAQAGLEIPLRHLANTPATLSRPDLHLDAVRVGLGLYGLSPFPERTAADLGLRPVMSLRTRLANLKQVPAGQGISYGLRYHTSDPTTLALIPMGYADGVPRSAENAPVAIPADGPHYTSSGRIAMDQFVVDLHTTDPGELAVGDTVELFGEASGIDAAAWAAAAGTINYEIVTRITDRVPRIHVNQDAAATPTLATAREPLAQELTLTLNSLTDTARLATALAAQLTAGDLMILTGDLGAGKTTFTQHLARALGITDSPVTSPTFVLARHHHAPDPAPDLVHVDAYRLTSADELASLDLVSTLPTSLTVIEWGRHLAEDLADSWLDIELSRSDSGPTDSASTGDQIRTDFSDPEEFDDMTRRVIIRAYGPRFTTTPLTLDEM